jgi:hypothetical protein
MARLTLAALLALVLAGTAAAAPPEEPPVRVVAAVPPPAHLFGDVVVAELSLSVDPRRADPGSVRVEPGLAPLRAAGQTGLERGSDGGAALLRYSFPVQCTVLACLPRAAVRKLALRSGSVHYRLRDAAGERSLPVRWQATTIASRLTVEDIVEPQPHGRIDEAGPSSFRIDPHALGLALAAAAALLALATGVALARRLELRPHTLPPAPATDLELALAAVEAATELPEDERRVALERLARTLGGGRQAREARRLAWVREPPPADAMRRLVEDVRR